MIAVLTGSGQVTRYAAEAKADILIVITASMFRQFGVSSLASYLPFGNANEQTEELLLRHVLPRAETIPVVAGVMAGDPGDDLNARLKKYMEHGVAGIINWPAVETIDGNYRAQLESEGIGLHGEAQMLKKAHELGLATFGFATSKQGVEEFLRVPVDALLLSLGRTRQIEDIYEKRDVLQQSITHLNDLLRAAKRTRHIPLCLAFGGVATTAEDLQEIFHHTNMDGFAGGSALERIPIKTAVVSMIRQFKGVPLHRWDEDVAGEMGGMVGQGPAMQEVFRIIRRIAPHNVPVCIEGESGTGKELAAVQIQRLSHRAGQAFVALNCGAIPDSLLESEFFGHEQGAFTGADHQRIGKFELADHGTLFLDEIADLSPHGQVALLRVLQQREITRIGGDRRLPVDVRVIAASNRNLRQLVERGAFRRDLYFRLSSIILTIPPLRERLDDIALLVARILSKLAIQLNKPLTGLSAAFEEELQKHSWPGNVRELEQVLVRSALLEDGPVLRGAHFLAESDLERASDMPAPMPPSLRNQSKHMRWSTICHAVDEAGGNKSLAATRLGVSRNTLYKWLKEIGESRGGN